MSTNYTKELTGEALEAYLATRFPKPVETIKPSKETGSQAFFYIDGIPTKGLWIDLDLVDSWEDVEEKLLDLFPSAQIDEILCSDIEGIGLHFYASNCDSFDMTAWAEFKEDFQNCYLDIEVVDAYFKDCGVSSIENVEDAYQGEYKDWTDFAYELLEQTGDLNEIPENLRYYFDYEKFGHDLSFDYFESDGYFFRNL